MELIEIEQIDYTKNNLTAVFDGIFKEGFYVETEFTYEEFQEEYNDDSNGQKDYYSVNNIFFWDFKTINIEEEVFNLNERDLKKIKDLVEFKLIDLLESNINNN